LWKIDDFCGNTTYVTVLQRIEDVDVFLTIIDGYISFVAEWAAEFFRAAEA
jgi:hypothetical protein